MGIGMGVGVGMSMVMGMMTPERVKVYDLWGSRGRGQRPMDGVALWVYRLR